ncbi:MAG TPA: ribbon-helix-helix domain-containing protein [Alphaproteobacteria bacterium]|nr:ribbon-helix-helix domain-containing protein [Alphaproteobacteria bacterium]
MSAPVKRSVTIRGHRTSLSLEPQFWDELKHVADARGISLASLIAEVDAARGAEPKSNLSSALRVFVLDWLRKKD